MAYLKKTDVPRDLYTYDDGEGHFLLGNATHSAIIFKQSRNVEQIANFLEKHKLLVEEGTRVGIIMFESSESYFPI